MSYSKNITNGQIQLDIDVEDRVAQNIKFMRIPGGDIYDIVRKRDASTSTNYYIQNIRTGSFSQISEKYLMESKAAKQFQTQYTTNSFQTEMIMVRNSVETSLSKSISFFQGLFAGMALLFTITLNLSQQISQPLVRIQDQCIRVVALVSTLGSFIAVFRAKDRYEYIKLRGTSLQIDLRYKCLILAILQTIFYTGSYVFYNVSHPYSVNFNIQGKYYQQLRELTTIYTVLCLVGWIITNVNTKKHQK